jgi:basic amino acid/polyamine antiporter, APA family
VDLILTIAMFGLFQCFNGNFAASTRLLYAFGRNGTVNSRLARVHPRFQTPSNAVLAVAAGSLGAIFLGDAILVPVTEVGSAAAAYGWLAACVSFLLVTARSGAKKSPDDDLGQREQSQSLSYAKRWVIPVLGTLAALALVLMKFLPNFPGHFSVAEYIALAFWLLLGFVLRTRPGSTASPK